MAVGSEDDRAPLVALGDDLVELLGLGNSQGGQTEVIDDQQVRVEKLSQCLFPATIGTSCVEVSEQLRALDEQGGVTDSAGLISQRLGQMGLAHARWPVKNHMLLLCHEQPRGKILDGRNVDAGERGELELFEGLGFFEGCLFQTLVVKAKGTFLIS